jgi:acetyl esterase/lipase
VTRETNSARAGISPRTAPGCPGSAAAHDRSEKSCAASASGRTARRQTIPTQRYDQRPYSKSKRASPPSPGPERFRSALLWIHGGGYVIGSARGEDRVCREFADALGITVAAVDYRLAPEHPFPAPLEDCYTGLLWLAQQSFVNPARIAIGGPSAGGGLAAALALLARDRGQVTPVLQLLSYPMLDDRTVSPTGPQRRNRLWDHRSNRFGWTSYLGGADPRAAVPVRRQDLTGLAPPGSALAH